MRYIARSLEKIFKQASKEYPVVMLTGPRQVGKTTMLLKLMENTDREAVSLDDLTERDLARSDPELFLQIHKPPVLIDEVQYAPELYTYIKKLADEINGKGEIWLTSSQAFKLMEDIPASLGGRVAVLTMTTLSQAEISGRAKDPFMIDPGTLEKREKLRRKVDVSQIYERIYKGSMPALVSGEVSDNQVFYGSYISAYIERDVRELSESVDVLKFLRFMTAVAARAGSLLNISEIAQDADINLVQARSWLNILETLGIIFYLQPYSNNLLKRLVKTPKIYFYDTGLVCYLTKWSSAQTLENGAMSNAILENYVVAEIAKTYLGCGLDPPIYYYRDKDMKEISLILEKDGGLYPIEIKKTSNPVSKLTKVFSLLDKSSVPRKEGAVICVKPNFGAIDRDNFIVPVWMI